MLLKSYSEDDLKSLTVKARTLLEYDFNSEPKKIKRRENVIPEQIPLKAIYRMVVEDWAKPEFNCYHFPFSNSSFANVIGLADGWDIPVKDRKYIEKDMILFASDARTILILPSQESRWWETTWFQVTMLAFGFIGLLVGFLNG